MKLNLKLFPAWVVCAVVAGWVSRASADYAPLPFHDGFEFSILNTNYWTLQGTWGLTTESAHTGTNSLTDSPRSVYTNNTDSSAILSVDLRSAWAPMLQFWNRYAFELNRDFGFVEVSSDFGASWTRWGAVTAQGGTNWYPVQLDLTPYAGTMLMIRFRLISNGANTYDGWYVDDVSVTENTALAVYPFFDNMDGSASNWLACGWQQVPGGAQGSGGQSWQCRIGDGGYTPGGSLQQVMTLASPLDLSLAVAPRLSFWWREGAMYNNTLYAQASHDGGMTWNTVWSWNSYNNGSPVAWSLAQADLSAYQGYPEVAVRFLAYNAPGDNFNLDFQVDNVLVDEAPADVTLTASPGADPRNSAQLNWTQSASPTFAYYSLFRSTSPGVTPASQLVTIISNRTTLSFQDTNLAVCGQTYYYRVLVWETNGLHNWGLADVSYRTSWGQRVSAFPFTDGLETGDANWAFDWPWGITGAQARTGTHSLTDSPGGDYANNTDASATLHVYLTGLNRPLLTFWQLYSLELNRDFGFVEVSGDNGTNWSRLAGVTGDGGTNWQQQQIDLTPYAGVDLLIRFRLKSNASVQDDGWYIDDVSITDNAQVAGYPFYDNMDTSASATNWLTSAAWQQVGGSAQTNAGVSWRCLIGDNGYNPGGSPNYYQSFLTLAGTLNLQSSLKPLLSFWWREGAMYNNTLYAQMSKDGGKNWATVWSWNSYNNGNPEAWNQVQVSLTNYLGYTNTALRFVAWNSPGDNFNLDFQVDQVGVAETPAPPPEIGASVAPGPDPRHSATLTWSNSTAPGFAYYAIYRSTSPGVSVSSTLIATNSNQAANTFTDTGLDVCGQTYYYRVIVWNNSGLHSTGTDLPYRTAWAQTVTSFPFTDGLEGSDANWALDRPWALATDRARTGTHCLTDSPGGTYANNTDASATLRVYLNGINRPLLTFWQLYSLELNRDFGFVEVSTDDGNSWARMAGVTGYGGTNWQSQQIDLTPYSGSTALIRFRLKSNASVQDDGWYIDDVSISDNSQVAGYPFYDSMDSSASATNWLSAAAWQWVGGSAQTNAGGSWQCQVGDNGYNPGGSPNYYESFLTLAGTLNLRLAVNPRLSFWWREGAMYNNTLYAQMSKDGGKNWSTVWSWNSYNNGNPEAWNRVQADLSGYLGYTNAALRFIAWNSPGDNFNLDFQVDQVLVDEAPADVAYTVGPGPDPRHSAQITWSPSTAPDFAYYAVYRSTSPGVTPSSTLLTNITSQSITTFTDPGLDVCGQTYYYRVMVWDNSGLHTWGTSDVTYRTTWGQTVTSFPFADGLEGGDASWALDRPWALATDRARTGTHCLTDSPGGTYANNTDASATLRVVLNGLNRPLLTFWQLYSLELNRDFGFVEVSTDDGNSWARMAGVTGYGGTNWQSQQIDLTPYSGSTALIRFRLKSNGSVPDDGWYIDDVSITDNGQVAGYPFYDSMDNPGNATNWLTSAAWQWVGGSAQTNAGGSWQCRVGDNGYNPGGSPNYYQSLLTLAGTLNLRSAVNPRLSFWWREGAMYNNTLYAQMSKDGGKNWATVWSWNSYNNGNPEAWNRVQVDLSGYLGYTNAALRFIAWNSPGDNFNLDFQVDQVLVDEVRSDLVVTAAPGPDPLHSATLNWTPASGNNFAYYAIYRSTSPGVTPTNTLLATIPNRSTLSFTDASLPQCGQIYYYRVLAYYGDGYNTTGTTDTVYRTAWGATITELPFADQFESANSYWALDWPWGTTTQEAHSGTHALTDSPGTLYGNNANGSATMQVDLRLANRPVLAFWQMYALELNRDYGFVEISSNDGASWSTVAAVTGHAGWGQTRIDLGPYAGTVSLIRWRLKTDAQNVDDGWYLDDVVISENTAVAAYPLYDSVDDPQRWTNWIASSWIPVGSSAQDLPGFSWRCPTGDGTISGSNYYSGVLSASLTLAGTLDLSHASVPKLWFWWRAGQQWYHTLAAQVSPDGGHNWNTVWIVNTLDSGASPWQQAQVVLTNTAGLSQVGLRFVASNPGNTPVQLDFQVDQMLVGERDGPTLLTASPLPAGMVGSGYNVPMLASNGTLPYTWSVVSNTLPPGFLLNPASGVLSGTPTTAGNFTFWIHVADSASHFNQEPFTLAVQNVPPPLATQSSQPFVSPGTNVVFCQVTSQTASQLLALAWSPTLPAGWTVTSVSGDGAPSLGLDGNITLLGGLTNNPLNLSYTVRIPAGQSQGGVIAGTVTYQYAGMPLPATTPAQPQLLSVTPRIYHSADCNQDWIIETTEANQVIAYWRAGAYQLNQFSCDGYAPGQGNRIGPLHSADYEPPYWQIDTTELNRVLAYWRAGCYQADTNGPDGYAAGCASIGMLGNVAHSAPSFYSPGGLVTVTNSVQYSGSLLSLVWRPALPAGWTLQSVSGDGSPELGIGDITWTSPSLPPSPIHFNYVVQVAPGDTGLKQIRGEVDYMLPGSVTALQTFANPDPLTFNANAVASILISSITRLSNGAIQLGLQGTTSGNVRVQYSPAAQPTSWNTLVTLPPLAGSAVFTDTTATNSAVRFYRLVSP
jgi:hypothetical protein